MPDDDTQQNQQEAIEVEASGGDKSKMTVIIMIVLAVLVMVLTPVITVFVVKTMSKTPEKEAKPSSNFALVKINDINVNIADVQGTRYVSINVCIEVDKEDLKSYFLERTAENKKGMLNKIKSEIIYLLSDKNLDGLLSKKAKQELAREIRQKINSLLKTKTDSEGLVTEVYFSKFLVQ